MSAWRPGHRVSWFVAAQLLATAIGLCWLAASPAADPTEAPSAAAELIPAGDTPWVGVGGCAAAACHGGPSGGPRGEYTTWISSDPHSRAYSVLFGKTSLEMARQLAGGDATKVVPPHEDRRCLDCHAPTGPRTERSPQLVGDGVGCEACHGAADGWASQHATIRWKELAPAEQAAKRKALGMADTRDPLIRARQCTPCHVGHDDADVTHDLIAAGHPRMSFELGAFHNELPKHWPHQAERRHDPAFEAKLWAYGYAVGLAAHEELLAARSERGGFEFANYDCYACHHELRSPSLRPQDETSVRRPGELLPLVWYDMPSNIADGESALSPGLPKLATIDAEPSESAAERRSRAAALREWAAALNAAPAWERETIEDLQVGLAKRLGNRPSWDEATRWYLAMAAMERSRLDYLGAAPKRPIDEQVQRQLATLHRLLEFPAGTVPFSVGSPRDYDPAAFRAEAARLDQLLTERQPLSSEDAP